MPPLIDTLLDLALQPLCRRCWGPAPSALLCGDCWQELPWNRPACRRCAEPLNSPLQPLCRRCARRAPPQTLCVAAWRYQQPVSAWIQACKFARQLGYLPAFADALAEALCTHGAPRPDLLLPVPLHPERLRQRGFNQSELLAQRLARQTGLPLARRAARRLRPTPPQSRQASRAERRRNLRGAFAVDIRLHGLHCALIDDVITTGATVESLAQACRRAGAARVDVWALARTPAPA